MIVVALVTTVLVGLAGGTAYTELVVHSAEPTEIIVQGTMYKVNGTAKIDIPIELKRGVRQTNINVSASNVVYELPITLVGKQDHSWLWYLSALPVITLLLAVRFRRTRADSS